MCVVYYAIFSWPRAYFQQEVARLVSAEVVNGTVSQHSHNQTSLARLQYSAGQGQEAEQERLYMEEEEHTATTNAGLVAVLGNNINTTLETETRDPLYWNINKSIHICR